MKVFLTLVMTIAMSGFMHGCAETVPLISHAHVGHALTAWGDTPGQKGLFIVARESADSALLEAERALQAQQSRQVRQHIRNALRALNPDLLPPAERTEQDYGAVRALEGSLDHIEYAASSDDASLNILSRSATIVEHGQLVIERLKSATQLAYAGLNADAGEIAQISFDLRQQLRLAINGGDIDGDGVIGSAEGEIGLRQLDEQMQVMLAQERDPLYEPLPKKYVLGLIRLSDGSWVYDLKRDRSAYWGGSNSYD